MDIWWEYFPILEIFVFSSLKTLFLQKWTPQMDDSRGFIDLFIFSSSSHLVAQAWCTLIYFPSATEPGTKSLSFWCFQLFVLLFTEWPSTLAWQYVFPKKCSNFCIQGSTFTPGIRVHHFPRAPEATVTQAVMGGWREQERQQGLDQSHHSKFSHQECQGISRILTQGSWDFSSALKRCGKLQSKTTKLQFCVSGRDGDFKLTQQNLIPWTQQLLFCWNSVILSLQSHFLSIPSQRCCFVIWLTGTLFPANHRLHTRNVLDVQEGKIRQTNTKKRDINSLVLGAA